MVTVLVIFLPCSRANPTYVGIRSKQLNPVLSTLRVKTLTLSRLSTFAGESPVQTQNHPLLSPSCGTHRHVTSFHFGTSTESAIWPGKVYIQSGLHAGEIPGMLVSHHLKALLTEAEAQGRMRGEVVLVPLCNPIGVSQALLQYPIGRFEFSSGENFNRYYLSPDEELAARVADDVIPAGGVGTLSALSGGSVR